MADPAMKVFGASIPPELVLSPTEYMSATGNYALTSIVDIFKCGGMLALFNVQEGLFAMGNSSLANRVIEWGGAIDAGELLVIPNAEIPTLSDGEAIKAASQKLNESISMAPSVPSTFTSPATNNAGPSFTGEDLVPFRLYQYDGKGERHVPLEGVDDLISRVKIPAYAIGFEAIRKGITNSISSLTTAEMLRFVQAMRDGIESTYGSEVFFNMWAPDSLWGQKGARLAPYDIIAQRGFLDGWIMDLREQMYRRNL